MKKRIFILFLLLTQMVLSISAQDADSLYSKNFLAPGTVAPDFTLITPNGTLFKLSSQRGRYVVIDFFASWCRNYSKIRPRIDELTSVYENIDSVVFVGVSYDTHKKTWVHYLNSDKGDFMLHVCELKKWEKTKTPKQYGISSLPTMYLIDPTGKVVMATTDVEKLTMALKNIDKSKITSKKQNYRKFNKLMDLTLAKYKGGNLALFKFLSSKVKYPKFCEQNGVTGKISVMFVVGKHGALDSVYVENTQVKFMGVQLTDEEQQATERKCKRLFEAEAVRVVRSMKKWTPASRYGRLVRMKFTVPVTFKLR